MAGSRLPPIGSAERAEHNARRLARHHYRWNNDPAYKARFQQTDKKNKKERAAGRAKHNIAPRSHEMRSFRVLTAAERGERKPRRYVYEPETKYQPQTRSQRQAAKAQQIKSRRQVAKPQETANDNDPVKYLVPEFWPEPEITPLQHFILTNIDARFQQDQSTGITSRLPAIDTMSPSQVANVLRQHATFEEKVLLYSAYINRSRNAGKGKAKLQTQRPLPSFSTIGAASNVWYPAPPETLVAMPTNDIPIDPRLLNDSVTISDSDSDAEMIDVSMTPSPKQSGGRVRKQMPSSTPTRRTPRRSNNKVVSYAEDSDSNFDDDD